MKKCVKILALLMAAMLLLAGCGAQNATEPTDAAIMTEEELTAALADSGRITLGADIALTGEVLLNGQVFNGGGYTLTGPAYAEGNELSENAITLTAGTVENVVVKGAYRGIGDRKGYGASGDIRINNVVVDSDTYVLNFGNGDGQGKLFVSGSTLLGWTSYTKFAEAQFTDCTFGWCESGQNGNLRPYINTTLIGCKFEGRTEADGTVTPFNISFKNGTDGILLVLEDCYVGDTLITQDNLTQLLAVNLAGNQIVVRNSN